MGWWRRLLGREPLPGPRGEENILVISDIHLGEDIQSSGPAALSEPIRALNQALVEFVAYHRQRPRAGRPWHLVFNGDMFDFARVGSPRVPNTAQNVVSKLERILEAHGPLVAELAAFLLDGQRVTIVEGNHDAELYFNEVRSLLRARLVGLARERHQRDGRAPRFDAAAVGERLQFQTWFEAAAGRYHIEHGHQYDEYCSFEYNLAPYDRRGAKTLATPLDRLKATPAEYSRTKMIRVFYVDRFLVVGALTLVAAIVWSAAKAGAAVLWTIGIAAVGAALLWGLGGARRVDLPEKLRRAAARIARETGVRYVVFGHSHRPELVNLKTRYGVERLGGAAFYLNTGSWVTREILRGVRGYGMTYVEITGQGAALRRWLGPDHEPDVMSRTEPETGAGDNCVPQAKPV